MNTFTIDSFKKLLKENNIFILILALVFVGGFKMTGVVADNAIERTYASGSGGSSSSDGVGATGDGVASGTDPGDSSAGGGDQPPYVPPTEPVITCNDDGVRASRDTNYPSWDGWSTEGENKIRRPSTNQYSIVRYGRDVNNCLLIQGREDTGITVNILGMNDSN
jgi:hypothetical protein